MTLQSFYVSTESFTLEKFSSGHYTVSPAIQASPRERQEPGPSQSVDEEVQIFVKNLQGKSIAIMISVSDTVDTLKEKVLARTGVPTAEQRLLFGGKQLEPGRTISDYGIQKENTVHLGTPIH